MPDFTRAPRAGMSGPRFGGAPSTKQTGAKFARGNARAFARVRRAEECLTDELLPAKEGESTHYILDSRQLSAGDILIALIARLGQSLTHLRISTLTLSAERQLPQLCELLDRKTASKISLLVSEVFKAKFRDAWGKIIAASKTRPFTVAASRTHAKVCCLELADKTTYVLYGSGNLKSANSLEQLTLARDRGVHDFYAAWIDDQMATHAHTQTETE